MYIKCCGMMSEKDVNDAISCGADAVGFIFTKSRRQVRKEDVRDWLSSSKDAPVDRVGVFVNECTETIQSVMNVANLDIIQLHGEETLETVREVKAVTGKRVIKAFPHQGDTLQQLGHYAEDVDIFLIDAGTNSQRGGTGKAFDWKHVPPYIQLANRLGIPIWIAGGINEQNVATLCAYRPDGVDVSSGIEKDGVKDKPTMRRLIGQVKDHG
ncbi:phosphoribosylanthranilate isomerase [Geomicrobium sp. JCM 19037]|uniref:phosphoribosylanthranilate isomerase n=1 Tax=Geomicrobium sp. JCM 19037 TaxID=1460634 RepID=UPI00045F3C76|nr:phosphoribosylanthranilate isomerase [Geomicrobium sp. JCM 19037]GAK02426.1 phosphoribosylanthranilate isomerase [Geomicrobium sp. JCM 19037]